MRKRDRERYRQLAKLIRERREELGISLTELARRSGLGQPWLSDVERHERIPDLFDFVRLVRGLGLSVDDSAALIAQLLSDRSLDLPPIPPPPPRKTKGRPTRREWE